MEKKQEENRLSAARKFMSSLNELEVALQSEDEQGSASIPQNGSDTQTRTEPLFAEEVDLDALFAEAVQDIERFMSEHPDN